jgi:hypothetical protein
VCWRSETATVAAPPPPSPPRVISVTNCGSCSASNGLSTPVSGVTAADSSGYTLCNGAFVESFNVSQQCGAAFGLDFYSPTTALPNSFFNNLTGVYLFFMSSGGNQARACAL